MDIGKTTPNPKPPRTEDQEFLLEQARLVGQLDGCAYWQLLNAHGQDELRAIFGNDLAHNGRSFAVKDQSGNASLGILRPADGCVGGLYVDSYEGKQKLRIHLDDPAGSASPSVTDIRLVREDHQTIDLRAMDDVNERISDGIPCVLMMGLAYPFWRTDDQCWLQVNGICLEDRPLGDTP